MDRKEGGGGKNFVQGDSPVSMEPISKCEDRGFARQKISEFEVHIAVIEVEAAGLFHEGIRILSLPKRPRQQRCQQAPGGNAERVFPKIAPECRFTVKIIRMAGLNHGKEGCDCQVLQAAAMRVTQHVVVQVEPKILKCRMRGSVVQRCDVEGRIAECEVGGISGVAREYIGQADFYIEMIGETVVESDDQARSSALTDSHGTCGTRARLVSKVIVVAIEKNSLHRQFDSAIAFRGKPSLRKQGGRSSQEEQEGGTLEQQEPGKSLRTIHAGYFFASSLVSSRLAFISMASSRTDRYAPDLPGVFRTTWYCFAKDEASALVPSLSTGTTTV